MLGGFPRHRCSNSRSPLCLSTVLPHLTRCLCPAAHESGHDKSITTHLRPPPQVGYNCRVVGMGLLTGDLTSLMGTSHPKVRKSNVISGVATLGKGDGKDPRVVCASTACRARCSGGPEPTVLEEKLQWPRRQPWWHMFTDPVSLEGLGYDT